MELPVHGWADMNFADIPGAAGFIESWQIDNFCDLIEGRFVLIAGVSGLVGLGIGFAHGHNLSDLIVEQVAHPVDHPTFFQSGCLSF